MKRASLFLVLVVAGTALAQPPVRKKDAPTISLPANVQAQPGTFVIVEAQNFMGDDIAWMVLDQGLSMIPTSLLARRDVAVVMGMTPGNYRLIAIAATVGPDGRASLSPIAVCVVTIGNIPPGPGPGPIPPGPTPGPTDPFAAPLSAAFAVDATANKAGAVRQLAAVYRTLASTAVPDPSLATMADLWRVETQAGTAAVPKGQLTTVRTALAGELSAQLGVNGSQPLDAATRSKVAAQFNRMASLLEGLQR